MRPPIRGFTNKTFKHVRNFFENFNKPEFELRFEDCIFGL
jgi:hypothetical protein